MTSRAPKIENLVIGPIKLPFPPPCAVFQEICCKEDVKHWSGGGDLFGRVARFKGARQLSVCDIAQVNLLEQKICRKLKSYIGKPAKRRRIPTSIRTPDTLCSLAMPTLREVPVVAANVGIAPTTT